MARVQATETRLRQAFNRTLSTFLLGSDLPTWRRLLRENRPAIDPEFLPRAGAITAASLYNSAAQVWEERRFGDAIAGMAVAPPLVVVGHWRSGLAHVQRLLALDERFAFPNLHQVRHPRTFLLTERAHTRLTDWMLPARHPGDGLVVGHALPEDDEFALANLTGASPYIGGLFPRRRAHYVATYLSMESAARPEVDAWKQALIGFARKLTWKHDRPLVLRSPTYTARLPLLLDVFPDARVLHVHRHPYAVFRATCRSTGAAQVYNRLHRAPPLDVAPFVLDRYTKLYDAFFAHRGLFRSGRLHEIGFDSVVRDPVGTLRGVYEALELPPFDRVRSRLEGASSALSEPADDERPPLDPPLRERVACAWQRSFATWGYHS